MPLGDQQSLVIPFTGGVDEKTRAKTSINELLRD